MIGPSVPAHLLSQKSTTPDGDGDTQEGLSAPSVGPQIPSHFVQPGPQVEEEEEEDDYAPALPPDLLVSRATGPASNPKGNIPSMHPGRRQGPSLPPEIARGRQDESDDDDDYGPQPLPSGFEVKVKSAVEEFMEKEERRKKMLEDASKPKALKREEWMLVPPSASDLLGNIDTTKLNKPRQFARTTAPARAVDTTLWTETPAERQQRLADEVAGKRRRAEDQAVDLAERGKDGEENERRMKRRRDEEIRAGVDEYTRKTRGPSLVNQHSTKPAKEDPPDGPPVIWDHARDMSLGGRLMDDKSRNKMIRDAGGLGDRFSTGKSGGFL